MKTSWKSCLIWIYFSIYIMPLLQGHPFSFPSTFILLCHWNLHPFAHNLSVLHIQFPISFHMFRSRFWWFNNIQPLSLYSSMTSHLFFYFVFPAEYLKIKLFEKLLHQKGDEWETANMKEHEIIWRNAKDDSRDFVPLNQEVHTRK
jgi:hypothetical protein